MVLGKMIKNIFKSMAQWINSDDNVRARYSEDTAVSIGYTSGNKNAPSGPSDRERGLNFTVFPATGGKVVQFSSYDPRADRYDNRLYIVTDREDLGEELGQIITKESLSR